MISIIIPCKGHLTELTNLLEGISRLDTHHIPHEVLVVDSDNDPEKKLIAAAYSNVRVLETPHPMLPALARNLGAEQAQGEILVFIDADCIPDTKWLRNIAIAFEGGAILMGGAVATSIQANRVARTDNLLQFYNYFPSRPPGPIDSLPGCNLAVRAVAFRQVGGFPHLEIAEDLNLVRGIAEISPEQVLFIPRIQVIHFGRNTKKSFYSHHYSFGYLRAIQREEIATWQLWVGRFSIVIPFVMFKRFTYIVARILHYERWDAVRYFDLFPWFLYGLWAGAIGFRNGCRVKVIDKR